MKISIAGPVSVEQLKPFLYESTSKFPKDSGHPLVAQLINEYQRRDIPLSVYTLSKDVSKPTVLHGPKLKLFYGISRPKHRMRNFMRDERNYIRDFIINDQPDIVHCYWTYEYALGALAATKNTIITLQDWAPIIFYLQKDLFRFGRLLMHFATIAKGSHFTVNSEYLKQFLQKYIKNDVPVIPNAIDNSLFTINNNIKKNNSIIAVNDGFGKRKNVRNLLRAFKLITNVLPTYKLNLVGTDYQKNGPADEWAIKNGLAKNVYFLGPQSHSRVIELMNQSKLFIHPSLEESFGMVLIEAMSQKTPVIGGNKSGAVPWVLDYGNVGILTDVSSAECIANEAIEILKNDDKWKHFSQKGYEHAKTNFSISKIADLFLKQYDAIQSKNNK